MKPITTALVLTGAFGVSAIIGVILVLDRPAAKSGQIAPRVDLLDSAQALENPRLVSVAASIDDDSLESRTAMGREESPVDSESSGHFKALVDPHRAALEGMLDGALQHLESAEAGDINEIVDWAHVLEQSAVVALLDLRGQFELLPEEGAHVTEQPPGKSIVIGGGRVYTILETEFPGFHQLKEQAQSHGPIDADNLDLMVQLAKDRCALAQQELSSTGN